MIKHEPYKKCRNKNIELLRLSKQTYYQCCFEQNKKYNKTICHGIHTVKSSRKNKEGSNISAIIADDNTFTNPIDIAENCNNFFTPISMDFQKKILPTKKSLTKKTKCNRKSSKSVGPCSIPINIMKRSKKIICLPLSQLIKDSASKGTFPKICKLAQAIYIFENDSRLFCNNYRPISLI